jgi:hypothetical protein
MQKITQGYKSVSLLVELNWDSILATATVISSLYAGAYIMLG